mgnify:CR=1 FL=1
MSHHHKRSRVGHLPRWQRLCTHLIFAICALSGLGFIKVGATNSGSTAVTFPAGAAYAGWNDRVTITGGTGSAIWLVPLKMQGALSASSMERQM